MHVYVFCWTIWPGHGTVCASCKTREWHDRGTTKRVTSPVYTYDTSFTTTYCSSHTLDSLLYSTLANKGINVYSSLCNLPISSGICHPLTSRHSVDGLGTGTSKNLAKCCCQHDFLGPLVPPCNRLSSKSGSGCRTYWLGPWVTTGNNVSCYGHGTNNISICICISIHQITCTEHR